MEGRSRHSHGVYDIHTNSMQRPGHMQPTHAKWEMVDDKNVDGSAQMQGRLPPLDPVYARSFGIHDLCLHSAPESWLGTTDSYKEEIGLASIPPTVLEELPVECLRHFEEAKAREADWRSKWHTEAVDGLRARLHSTVDWYPKPKT